MQDTVIMTNCYTSAPLAMRELTTSAFPDEHAQCNAVHLLESVSVSFLGCAFTAKLPLISPLIYVNIGNCHGHWVEIENKIFALYQSGKGQLQFRATIGLEFISHKGQRSTSPWILSLSLVHQQIFCYYFKGSESQLCTLPLSTLSYLPLYILKSFFSICWYVLWPC